MHNLKQIDPRDKRNFHYYEFRKGIAFLNVITLL